jgi:hypothetical protein
VRRHREGTSAGTAANRPPASHFTAWSDHQQRQACTPVEIDQFPGGVPPVFDV